MLLFILHIYLRQGDYVTPGVYLFICPLVFTAPQLVPAGTAEARTSYGNSVCLSVCLSVCPSVTTRWYTKPRWDRDSGSSPYGSLEHL